MFRLTATPDRATKKPSSTCPSPRAPNCAPEQIPGQRSNSKTAPRCALRPALSVEFPELARRDSGGRSSNLELQSGTAYLNFKGDKQEQFTLGFGQEKLTADQAGASSYRDERRERHGCRVQWRSGRRWFFRQGERREEAQRNLRPGWKQLRTHLPTISSPIPTTNGTSSRTSITNGTALRTAFRRTPTAPAT